MVVTRTSSCQSDSSGLMEELPEPVVLQNASLSEKMNLILDIHNEETILPRRTEFPMLNQAFQQKPDDCVAKVFFTASKSIFTVPGTTEAGSDQGEETHPLLTAENGEYEACNTEPHSSVQEMLGAMGRKEEKTGRKQLENEECTKEHSPCRSDAREEGDPSSSKFDQRLYFRTEHKKVNVSVTELIDINPEVISESKIRGEDEGERCLTEKYIGAACHERAREGRTEQIKGAWWDGEVASRDDTPLAANGVTNGQKFYKTDGDSKSTRCSSKTGLPGMRGSSPTHLTKSVSLDTVFCGKYRSHYWAEASGTRIVQRNHCCHCCPWTFPAAASPQCSMGCCSKCAATELRLLETPMLLQDTAMQNLAPCTLHEIEVMKSSCQRFQEKLDEIEQHLIEQRVLFSNAMPDEGREEDRYLQLLRRAVRQEVAELEFWLNDQACHVGKNVLMQLDQLLVEQSHLFSELGLSDGKGERKAQNKQALPDATDVVRPQSGRSELVLQRSPSKNNTATGSLSSLQSGPSPMPFPTRATREHNSAESYSQKLSITKKEIKGPPQAKNGL